MGLGDFQILTKIGEGSYSSVWKVRRISDGQEYAMKKIKLVSLSDKEKQNSVNEVRILASIQDPTIVAYKEAFIEDDSYLCIIMEYAAGGDLYNKILEHTKAKTYFKEQDVWNYAVQMIQGLKTLHEMKILHRDLKCANIFLDADGKGAKLGDLNVSKVLKNNLVYTQTGTPYYASPEVWRDQPYDSKSDIWSLGCVIYEMAALKPPFRAKDMPGLYKKVQKGVYDRIPDHFSNDLANLIGFCLKVSPVMRPTCYQLMKHSVVQRNCKETIERINASSGTNMLLSTIRFPKNMRALAQILPKPNYYMMKESDGRKLPKMSGREANSHGSYRYIPTGRVQTSIDEERSYLKHDMSADAKALRLDTKEGRLPDRANSIKTNDVQSNKGSDSVTHTENSILYDHPNPRRQAPSLIRPPYNMKVPKEQHIQTADDVKKNPRSKSTIPMRQDSGNESVLIADQASMIMLENGKMIAGRDITPTKILNKQSDIVASYRNRINILSNKNSSKKLMKRIYDENSSVTEVRSIIGRHVVSNRGEINKSAIEQATNEVQTRRFITEAVDPQNYVSCVNETKHTRNQNILDSMVKARNKRNNLSQAQPYKYVVDQILPRKYSESLLKKQKQIGENRL